MTVKELRELLAKFPDDLPVIISKDGEGNEHSPLAEARYGRYEADSTWSGHVYAEDDEEIPDHAVPCIVVTPVN
jgi:hypothetical protein